MIGAVNLLTLSNVKMVLPLLITKRAIAPSSHILWLLLFGLDESRNAQHPPSQLQVYQRATFSKNQDNKKNKPPTRRGFGRNHAYGCY
jgi:hypothetical protein